MLFIFGTDFLSIKIIVAHLTSHGSSCTITFTKFVWSCVHTAQIHDLYKNVLCLSQANSR